MAHLLMLGPWSQSDGLATLLQSVEHSVTLLRGEEPPPGSDGFGLIVGQAGTDADVAALSETARRLALPWVVRSGSPDPALATAAYRAGALSVLPWDSPPELVKSTVERVLATLRPAAPARAAAPERQQRRYRAGDRISLPEESVLEVLEGVVSLTVLHADGSEVLLGLYGPGHVFTGHPEDSCCIQLGAHTQALARLQPWAEQARRPDFLPRLRERLRFMEAWAAMQARPYLEARVLGILSLLAEQFGRRTPRGALVDVRITHAQLASAVGATRTTVTRLLGQLRRRGALLSVPGDGGERFCLREWEGGRHGL